VLKHRISKNALPMSCIPWNFVLVYKNLNTMKSILSLGLHTAQYQYPSMTWLHVKYNDLISKLFKPLSTSV